jgi:hypothetical protein
MVAERKLNQLASTTMKILCKVMLCKIHPETVKEQSYRVCFT